MMDGKVSGLGVVVAPRSEIVVALGGSSIGLNLHPTDLKKMSSKSKARKGIILIS